MTRVELSHDRLDALIEALDQYVENTREAQNHAPQQYLQAAEALLDELLAKRLAAVGC